MLDDFMIRALLAGIGVAIVAGPLGSFIVWKKMAFFGDAIAHSALLGAVLGIALGINLNISIVIIAAVISVFIVTLQRQRSYSSDTLLGIMAHSSLAIGLVTISFLDNANLNMMGFLFGDILSTSNADIIWIYAGTAFSLYLLYLIWQPLLLSIINQDIARVEGVDVDKINLKFMLLISLLVALAIKVTGILLVTSLLIIPAAAARKFAQTPERMALVACIIGILSVAIGLYLSLHFDTPSGPTIVVASVAAFLGSSFIRGQR